MKKRNLLFPVMAGMMFFTACSSEEELPSTGLDNGVQEINLQVSNNGDELQSRAGRELLSDAAGQKIDNVTVIICDDKSKIVYIKTVENWMTDAGVASYPNGRQTKIALQGSDKIGNGSYKIYAFGYSKDSDYNLTAIKNLAKDQTYTENVVLDYNVGKNIPEEIFAGSYDLTVTEKSFSASVVLNRQVAGAYVYAYNIPFVEGMNGDYTLELVASDYNDQLVLGWFTPYDLNGNGTDNNGHINYVVNGGKKTPGDATETVICSTKLNEWYSAFKDENGDKILDDAGWKTEKANANDKGGKYVKGSVFASNFVIPFKKIDGTQTLKLRLKKDNGEYAANFWNINLSNTDLAVNQKFTYWDGLNSKFVGIQSYTNTKNCYSIVRNHLYSVGKKYKDGKPTDPTDPDPKSDEPQDLSKSQNLTLMVNHNWEVIHRMELE